MASSLENSTTTNDKDNNNKKIKLDEDSQILIGTHSGTFHADEALAISLLRSLDRYKSSRLIRTRDPNELSKCDIVVDVGGEYDPSKNRFDHHQRGFEETYSTDHRIKLSSAGLVYKHFGTEIVSNHLGLPKDDPSIPILVSKLYDVFIQAIDGIDNGITQYEAFNKDGVPIIDATVKPKYHSGTGLSDRIAHLNPPWNEPCTAEILDSQFEKASALAGSEFFDRLNYYSKAWLPGREVVVKALKDRLNNQVQDPQGRVLVFQSHCPWKDHLYNLERSLISESESLPLYVIYPDESKKWRIQCIPKIPNGFESRLGLPEDWRGLRDSELSQKSGITDCIFVHSSGFIGGNENFEGVVEMARKALRFDKSSS